MIKEIMMRNIQKITAVLLLSLCGWIHVQAQSSTLELRESSGGCGLATSCPDNRICFDIILNAGVNAEVLSYNIWLKYLNSGLTYVSDSACITLDGNDNNLDDLGYYRVSGVLGSTMVQAGVDIELHTVCFAYNDVEEIVNNTISVGGTVLEVLHSPLTYNDPISNEPMLPDFPFLMSPDEISCLTLPVQWLSFEAHKKGEASDLRWSTAQEFNNAGFEVERSSDGRHFEPIGNVSAANVHRDINHYAYLDAQPNKGLNYYRIKQIDRDGQFDYSHTRTLSFSGEAFDVKLWPNPAIESLYVGMNGNDNLSGEIRLVSSAGITVLSKSYGESDSQAILDISEIEPGLYNLVIESAQNTYMEKIVVLK